MSSEKDQIESSVASDGSAPNAVVTAPESPLIATSSWPPGGISLSREESIAKFGLPNSFFEGTDPDRYTIGDLLRDSENKS